MKAVEIRKFGDPDGMAVVDAPAPTPARGQVLVATEAIGVGGVDAVIRRGTLGGGFAEGLIPGSGPLPGRRGDHRQRRSGGPLRAGPRPFRPR